MRVQAVWNKGKHHSLFISLPILDREKREKNLTTRR